MTYVTGLYMTWQPGQLVEQQPWPGTTELGLAAGHSGRGEPDAARQPSSCATASDDAAHSLNILPAMSGLGLAESARLRDVVGCRRDFVRLAVVPVRRISPNGSSSDPSRGCQSAVAAPAQAEGRADCA